MSANDGLHTAECDPEFGCDETCTAPLPPDECVGPVLDRSCWPAVSPVPDALRQAVADELARHQGLRGPMDDNRPDVWQNRCNCGWDDGDERPGWRDRYRLHVADAVIAVLNGPQSPPSDRGRAEGGDHMYLGGPSVELSSQDETKGRR